MAAVEAPGEWSDELKTALQVLKATTNVKASPDVVDILRKWYHTIPRRQKGAPGPDMIDFQVYFTPRAGWYRGETLWYMCDPHEKGVVTEDTFVIAMLKLLCRSKQHMMDQDSFNAFLHKFHKSPAQQERDLQKAIEKETTTRKEEKKEEESRQK